MRVDDMIICRRKGWLMGLEAKSIVEANVHC